MGPLAGIRIVEMAGIGPGPMAAMLLADLGAEVICVDRPEVGDLGIRKPDRYDLTRRSRRSLSVDLKAPGGVELILDLVERADVLIEGFRPGAMERMGLAPEVCLARNPRLVYGRMTGWGQTGPLAQRAGHDINYISLTGALAAIGQEGGPPVPPLNLVGDFGGGALYLVVGVLSALIEAGRSGQGQVVDAAMVDGAASLMTFFYGLRGAGMHNAPRGGNLLDSGAPHYGTYRCADGKYLAVGPIEKRFREVFLQRIGLDPAALPDAADPGNWSVLKPILAERLLTRTRDEWVELLQDSDACCTPVLDMDEAPRHPHCQARGTFVDIDGVVQPAPAPRFSRTPAPRPALPEARGASSVAILREWGIPEERIGALLARGTVLDAAAPADPR